MALCDRLEETRTVREGTRDQLTKASYARVSVSDVDDVTFQSHARFAVDTLPALTLVQIRLNAYARPSLTSPCEASWWSRTRRTNRRRNC